MLQSIFLINFAIIFFIFYSFDTNIKRETSFPSLMAVNFDYVAAGTSEFAPNGLFV